MRQRQIGVYSTHAGFAKWEIPGYSEDNYLMSRPVPFVASAGFLATVSLILLTEPKNANADLYSFTQLRLLSYAYGINDSGQIVGNNNAGEAFLVSGATYTPLIIGSLNTMPYGINNAGKVVGVYENVGSTKFSDFAYDAGTVTTLTPPSALGLPATYTINNSGDIVGSYGAQIGGFLWNGLTSVETFNCPGPAGPAAGTYPFGLNDSNDIVGVCEDNKGYLNGFLFSSAIGSFTSINVPSALNTQAFGINDAGEIVGDYNTNEGIYIPNGFVYSNGMFSKLDYPGSIQTQPFGINGAGDIVGSYTDASGNTYGFLASPCTQESSTCANLPSTTPEPSYYALTAGLTGLLVALRRRKRQAAA